MKDFKNNIFTNLFKNKMIRLVPVHIKDILKKKKIMFFQTNKLMRRVMLSHIFANFFNVWFIRRQLISGLLLHSICCDSLFWLKHMKKNSDFT